MWFLSIEALKGRYKAICIAHCAALSGLMVVLPLLPRGGAARLSPLSSAPG
jgi:hypothetical protein